MRCHKRDFNYLVGKVKCGPMKEFVYHEVVKVYDTDYQGIAHYASYYRFFTDSIDAFNAKLLGKDSKELVEGNKWFVVAESEAKYQKPLRIGDNIMILVSAKALSRKAIEYALLIKRDPGDETTTEGRLVLVCIDRNTFRPADMHEGMFNLLGL